MGFFPGDFHIFSGKVMRHHWSLLPSVATVAAGATLAVSYLSYMAITKPDMQWRPWKWGETPPYQSIGPHHVPKMLNLHKGKYEVDPEIVKLRQEIGSYSPK